MSDPITQGLAANVLRLGNECRDLSISNAVLRQENEELHKDYEALAGEHTKLIDRNKTLKAEVERMEHQVKYWRIEAETDNARWLRCLEELETLRKKS
jgi:predicted nuclease with TOPRIM domain